MLLAVTPWIGLQPRTGIAQDVHRLEASPTRHIDLEGQPNFRDLGGYQTTDGRTVKWRQVFRSGELPRLTDNDVATLKDLRLRSVINFLTQAELAAQEAVARVVFGPVALRRRRRRRLGGRSVVALGVSVDFGSHSQAFVALEGGVGLKWQETRGGEAFKFPKGPFTRFV